MEGKELMLGFSEAQERFRSEVRRFAQRELGPGAKERAKLDHVPPEVIKELAAAGLLKLTIPVEFGGTPTDCVTIGIVFEEICRVEWAPMALLLSHVLAPMMMEHASEELRQQWLPLLGRGEKLVCFGNTEPNCGSDASAITTRAVREGDSYILRGEKTSISAGMQADIIALTAKTDPEAGAGGVTCFFVPLDLPGVSRSRFVDMGGHPHGRASITLSDVRIPAKFRIGEEGEGFSKVMNGFDFARVLVALAGVGMAEASLAEAAEYVKERTAFGAPLSRFEAVSFKLAESATLIEASRLLCYQALKLRDEGSPHTKEAAMAKWFAARSVVEATHELLLIFGWRGYGEANRIEQRFRDVFGLHIGDGTAEIMKLIIAREILGSKFRPTI
jgi:cyclohexanecarboxyl-CoA dehydrogenase